MQSQPWSEAFGTDSVIINLHEKAFLFMLIITSHANIAYSQWGDNNLGNPGANP